MTLAVSLACVGPSGYWQRAIVESFKTEIPIYDESLTDGPTSPESGMLAVLQLLAEVQL
jgi:hypothetical protein